MQQQNIQQRRIVLAAKKNTAGGNQSISSANEENSQVSLFAAKSVIGGGADKQMVDRQQRAPLGMLASSKSNTNTLQPSDGHKYSKAQLYPTKQSSTTGLHSNNSTSASSAFTYGATSFARGAHVKPMFEVFQENTHEREPERTQPPKPQQKNSETESESGASLFGLLHQLPRSQQAALQHTSRAPLSTLYNGDNENTLASFDDVRKTHEQLFDVSIDSASKSHDGGSPMSIESPQVDYARRQLDLNDDSDLQIDDDATSSSAFQSAPSDVTSNSEYWTARTPSQKEQHMENVFAVPEFAEDMYDYLRHKEKEQLASPNYMRKQQEITAEMRTILVDWLIDVAIEYQMHEETLHLAVKYVDLTLTQRTVAKGQLQLLGASACMLAAKFEEIYPPDTKEFVYITDDSYTVDQVCAMERTLLNHTLKFQCSLVTPVVFLTYLMKLAGTRMQTEMLAYYLCELSLLDYSYLVYTPSVVASAALCVANLMTGPIPWPEHVERGAKLSLHEFLPCMKRMMQSFKDAPHSEQKAAYNKYSEHSRHGVALLQPAVDLSNVVLDV